MWYAIFTTKDMSGPNKSDKIVSWCILHSAPGMTRTYAWRNFPGIVFLIMLISKNKQRNVLCPTKADIIAVVDVTPNLLRKNYLTKYQGFEVEENILYQDTKNTTFLEDNVNKYSTKK